MALRFILDMVFFSCQACKKMLNGKGSSCCFRTVLWVAFAKSMIDFIFYMCHNQRIWNKLCLSRRSFWRLQGCIHCMHFLPPSRLRRRRQARSESSSRGWLSRKRLGCRVATWIRFFTIMINENSLAYSWLGLVRIMVVAARPHHVTGRTCRAVMNHWWCKLKVTITTQRLAVRWIKKSDLLHGRKSFPKRQTFRYSQVTVTCQWSTTRRVTHWHWHVSRLRLGLSQSPGKR